MIPFYQHDLGKSELDAIAKVLAGPILTTGRQVSEFEKCFAAYLGCNHALGVTSCTGALHLVLLALGIGPGDEVITSPMTFIATAGAVMEAGAKPVFVDVEEKTGNLDALKIEAAITQHTKAILPVHLYGQMCDMLAIREIADQYGLFVIEDSAHCVEGKRDGIRPGQLSHAACFSFYATKNITCGEGGAVVTNDDALNEKLRLLRLHGMSKTAEERHEQGYQHWDMTLMGWKYNMDNIQAALLLPQMAHLEEKLEKRAKLAVQYENKLSSLSGIRLPKTLSSVRHARHLFVVWVEAGLRDAVIQGLQMAGIGVVVNYRAIHLLSYLKESLSHKEGDFPIAELIGESTISLPFYPTMPEAHIHLVVKTLRELLRSA